MEHPDFEKGHPTKYVPEICKTEGEKVWVGECNVCKKITSKTCQKCELQFYCNKKHEHHDKKSHRKECKMKIEAKQEWKNKKVLDLEQDILKVATDLFSERYVSYDKKLGTWCMMPVGVRNVNGRKGYLIQVFEPQDPKLTLEDYKKKGFTQEMFYEIYSLSKAPLYHNAILLAIREMCVMYNIDIHFNDDPVTFYGIANVNVVSDFTPIELIYDWSDPDPSKWRKECLNTGHHKTLLFKTNNMGRLIVDFTAPQYGIIEYNVSNTKFPVWICPEEKQKLYKVQELVFPSDVEATITQMIREPSTFGNPATDGIDYFPVAVLSYKNALIQRIMARKTISKQISMYPPCATQIPIAEAVEKEYLR